MARKQIFIPYLVFFNVIAFEVQAHLSYDSASYEQDISISLHRLVEDDDIDGLRQGLQEHPEYINAINQIGDSLLQNAVRMHNLKMVEFLLSAGADVNFQSDENGRNTALHYSKNTLIMQTLIDHNADPNLVNARGNPPLFIYMTRKSLSLANIRILLRAKARTDIVSRGGFLALHLLFKTSVEKRYKGYSLTSWQQQKINEIRLEIARELIRHGADINALSKKESLTALRYAMRTKNLPAVEMLLHLGAEDIPDNKGYTMEGILRAHIEKTHKYRELLHIIEQRKSETPSTCAVHLT